MNQQFAFDAPPAGNAATPPLNDSVRADIFKDPEAFLKVLQDRAPRIATSADGQMSKNDLIVYAQGSGNDPQGRAAAQIAASHFDQLTHLSGIDDEKHSLLGPKDIQAELKHYRGEVTGEIIGETIGNAFETAAVGLSTAGLGVVTFFAIPEPPMALMAGACTLAGLLAFGKLGENLVHEPGQIRALSARTHDTFAGWSEINNWVASTRPAPAALPGANPSTTPIDQAAGLEFRPV